MKRYLDAAIDERALKRKKMAFVSGPRQVGKTTLSKSFEKDYDQSTYGNWDESTFRRLWVKSPNSIQDDFVFEKARERKLLILD